MPVRALAFDAVSKKKRGGRTTPSNRSSQGGRTTPKGTRPPDRRQSRMDDGTPPIVRDAEDACRQPDPLSLMLMASAYCESLADRPLDALRDDLEDHVDFEELAESFVMSGFPPMTALARAMAILHTDREVAQRVLDAVPAVVGRPLWAVSMHKIEITNTLVQSDPLNDGINVVVSFRWPSGGTASAVVYIDHNLGSIAKDAFVVPLSFDQMMEIYEESEGEHLTQDPISFADARAHIEGAIETFERSWPPIETDTWPTSRPFVEWLIGHLPEGGARIEHPEVSEAERDAVIDAFIADRGASIEGVSADDVRLLVSPLIDYACDDGPGDPLRWSATAVEMVLADWYARKVFGLDDELMRRLPDVLEQLVRHAHALRSIPAELTDDTVASIVEWTPEYLDALDEPGTRQDNAARIARMLISGDGAPDIDDDAADDDSERGGS